MTNEILWVVLMLVNFILITAIYKLWGVQGLYIWMGFSIVVANIQVLKTIEIFGITATLGNIIYGTTFLMILIMSIYVFLIMM
jgi:hypothetical protein